MSSLAGRTALVTGGSRGIGRAVALALAAGGARVAIAYRRDEEAARKTAGDIEAAGARGHAFRASVDDLGQCRDLAARVESELGALDILVHSAGIASRGNSVADTDPAELERVVRVHALGPHHLSQALLPLLRRAERSDVVFVSSVATDLMAAYGGPYAMGKAAMEALAQVLAKEERGNGMHVNVVAPRRGRHGDGTAPGPRHRRHRGHPAGGRLVPVRPRVHSRGGRRRGAVPRLRRRVLRDRTAHRRGRRDVLTLSGASSRAGRSRRP
ncbi:SDR family NAD(P)-dependent oxidoreductase [Actinomadura madurae]|uniref:SDR family NAD(P)-dependent oxidoreductase n=1 Tax=Actinomadura madurae TaxID=1993 RepID=UPI003D6AA152